MTRTLAHKTLIAYLGLSTFFIILSISCDIVAPECGFGESKFRTLSFSSELTSIVGYADSNMAFNALPLQSDTVRFDQLGINMKPITQLYSDNSSAGFSFIPMAYACTPSKPFSEEVVTDLRIYSNRNYNTRFSSDQNLAGLFKILTYYDQSGYNLMDLETFLATQPNVPNQLFLILTAPPEQDTPIRFTIEYEQDGFIMKEFSFQTDSLVIRN